MQYSREIFLCAKEKIKIVNLAGHLDKVPGKAVADGAVEEVGLNVDYRRRSGYTL